MRRTSGKVSQLYSTLTFLSQNLVFLGEYVDFFSKLIFEGNYMMSGKYDF